MEKVIAKILIIFFIAVGAYGIINGIILNGKKKVFTAAIVYEKSASGKNGTTYYFKYNLEGKEYGGNTKKLWGGTTNINGLLYIEVLADNYSAYHVLEFKKVPNCLRIADVPLSGWDKLPNDSICK